VRHGVYDSRRILFLVGLCWLGSQWLEALGHYKALELFVLVGFTVVGSAWALQGLRAVCMGRDQKGSDGINSMIGLRE